MIGLRLPPDRDPNGESDPNEPPPSSFQSEPIGVGPAVYLGGLRGLGADIARATARANVRGFTGHVFPGSRKAPNPVKKIQVAVQLLGKPAGKCAWLSNGHILKLGRHHGKCDQPVWENAKMTFKPHGTLVFQFLLPHGHYEAIGRAVLKNNVTNHVYPPGIDEVKYTT